MTIQLTVIVGRTQNLNTIMKQIFITSLLLVCGPFVRAEYRIVGSAMGSGGSVSSRTFDVQGIMGQSLAMESVSNRYRVRGGYPSFIRSVPTPGAPKLTIYRLGPSVVVAWPAANQNWVLEESPWLHGTATAWSEVASPFQTTDTEVYLTIPAPRGSVYFRLRQP